VSVLGLVITVGGRESPDAFRELKVACERSGAELVNIGKYVFPKLVPVFEAHEAQQFDEEGAGPSGKWAPLSPGYAAWKAKRYPNKPIMQRSGALHDALTSSSSSFARRVFSNDTFDFGTVGVPYATTHFVASGNRPARPPVDFGSDVEADVQRALMEATREAVRDLDEYFDLSGLA
jgi:phage gpG-like protein